jgi:beta-glucuronidase
VIPEKLKKDLSLYHQTFHKPIMLTEFGADTIAGLHTVPASIFSEEYQLEFIKTYVETIKELPFVIGEHVWNFADFMTKPGLTRMNGNKKGVFTRDRQPKMVAHWLKDYWKQSH